ncbi:MAG: response regulator, partial [Hydrogenovibrio sp.]|nr:response regulator [Hydrogenovibrio sp.]
MKLLLIEDERLLVDNLKSQLENADYLVDVAYDGDEANFMLEEYQYDLIILDLGLPKKPGLMVLEELRGRNLSTPVLILTARNSWQERVEGLKKGADDYLGKPFHFEELLARIEVLLKRPQQRLDEIIEQPPYRLNLDTRELETPDGTIKLTKMEFGLAKLFLANPQKVFSKEAL